MNPLVFVLAVAAAIFLYPWIRMLFKRNQEDQPVLGMRTLVPL